MVRSLSLAELQGERTARVFCAAALAEAQSIMFCAGISARPRYYRSRRRRLTATRGRNASGKKNLRDVYYKHPRNTPLNHVENDMRCEPI
jgi:hypothetical protein